MGSRNRRSYLPSEPDRLALVREALDRLGVGEKDRRERLDPISVLCEQPRRRVARRDDEVVIGPAKRLKQRREEPFGLLSGAGYAVDRSTCFENRVRFARNDSSQWTEWPASPSERTTASAESMRPSVIKTFSSICQFLPNNLPIAVVRTLLSPSAGSVNRRING